mmetsp:Transcript_17538/g.30203  ORF Transcript_17538/g.30203 Transcript_17538/m.30203 type:complete len:111 (+) Transcript_17538:90-422(+)
MGEVFDTSEEPTEDEATADDEEIAAERQAEFFRKAFAARDRYARETESLMAQSHMIHNQFGNGALQTFMQEHQTWNLDNNGTDGPPPAQPRPPPSAQETLLKTHIVPKPS